MHLVETLDNQHDQLARFQYLADYTCAYAGKAGNLSSKESEESEEDPITALACVITEIQKENEELRKSNAMSLKEKETLQVENNTLQSKDTEMKHEIEETKNL